LATGQCGLEQIGGIQSTTRSRTCTNQSVNFVNEQNGVRLVFECFQNTFETLFKITPVFGAGQQRTHVE
jgi:hypothetical protein